jgi:magnesium transporter
MTTTRPDELSDGSAGRGRRRPTARRRSTSLRPDPTAPRTREGGALINCAVYRQGRRLTDVADVRTAAETVRAGGGFVWIGLHEPDAAEIAELAELFQLHHLPVEDAVKAHQRPKLERYDDQLFAVLKTVRYCPHDELTSGTEVIQTGEVLVFLGERFIITVRHGAHGGLAALRARLEQEERLLSHGPSAVLHAVADLVVDQYLHVAEEVQEDVDEVEASVFGPRRHRRDVERIYLLKREMVELKRSITPLEGPMRLLAEREIPLVDARVRHYFRDVEDHLSRVREQIESYDELLTSILQASLAQLSVAENEDMRKITAYAALIAVPTAIAGIYGMNFEHMPELGWRFGYPLALAVMAAVCLLLWRGFKRNGWL